ncbi:alkaline phosphatase family protein [Blastopirellula sp. JC732]|uniref:Alkaline phosphatase family protein n=1 Tax=Blastopirellula sediminis TaxID=2894196 RepID=A0A9X1MJ72_9BACT|nr:alkaline phosphatase family protein [Blastopirellula sediminis]MCC9608027.1 alkaline phosphatase family protein [Blastopirellula sediminis]MCC9627180.1 alkaline phosphatase family protein [Blastopirellula sediminis]
MSEPKSNISRRTLLTGAALAAGAGATAGASYWLGSVSRVSHSFGKKVIVIGVDGMDPRLCRKLMNEGKMPNMKRMAAAGGFSNLGTSCPPQSPVAWANFINGAGPGSHGIFDFIHRHPHEQCAPFFSAAETIPGQGAIEIGDHQLQLDFWPFNHQPPQTVLRRQGVPFWDFLDSQRISSVFYDLPSNYPPSPSEYGHHKCVCGMGTPDMLGSYGTYQYFSEDTPAGGVEEGGGKRSRIEFEGRSARITLVGPENSMLKLPVPVTIDVDVHRDTESGTALLVVQGKKILLKPGEWSRWTKLDFSLSAPTPLPSQHASGICRFYLQEIGPNFRLYVTPINVDPSKPAVQLSEPEDFISNVSNDLGLFYTTGFQEDHKARSNGVFDDDEFRRQATNVLEERLALFEYAVENYDDGLLFFYFSSSDLQSHMFWWEGEEDPKHPTRTSKEAASRYQYVKELYQRLDQIIGDINDRYGDKATIYVMSDHGFANFGRQFNVNSWLRDLGYLNSRECTSILVDCDWSRTRAYGMGINGLYLNLKGRERDGIVEPGEEQEKLTRQLIARLKAVRDYNGKQVIRNVYRSSEIYSGEATTLAPDLIIGYARGYRASWETCLGELTPDVLLDNTSAWSADHCADALEVPGILCCNKPFVATDPSLVDIAPSILHDFGIATPSTMTGRSIFQS